MVLGAWHEMRAPAPERQYLFLLTYLQLRRFRSMLRFGRRARAIAEQLIDTDGVIGFALRSDLRRKRFWTLSVWDDEAALGRFVGTGAHLVGLREIRPLVSETRFIRWHGPGAQVPPDWSVELERLR